MFLSGVEESAAIAEFGDSGGLSKNGGRPVASVRSGGASDPKAADVRRRRRVDGESREGNRQSAV